jgi:hypothetical protein
MRLTREQSQELLRERGVWVAKACDRCGQLLGSIHWTRRGEPGEYCSAECRDGVTVLVPTLKAAVKECLECGVPLHGKRSDSEFCSRTHLMRHRRRTQTRQNCGNSGNTPIGKQGLTDGQNGESTNTLIPALSSYKRLKARSPDSQNFTLSTSNGFNKIRN